MHRKYVNREGVLMRTKVNVHVMKQTNLATVLQCIYHDGPLSRADIARRTGLSRPSVSANVDQLIRDQWVKELATSPGQRGRRPTPITIHPTGHVTIGVEIRSTLITIIVADLFGQVMVERCCAIKPHDTSSLVIDLIARTIQDLVREFGESPPKILGIGLGMHGMVDSVRGISLLAPQLGWKEVEMAKPLSDATGLPVTMDNDCNTAALAEQHFGLGRNYRNFITLMVDYGVGAGIVLNQQLYHGTNHSEGQIGHVVVDEGGRLCACGKHGCLETCSSEPAIIQAVRHQSQRGFSSRSGEPPSSESPSVTIEAIYQAALAGDPLSRSVVELALKHVGVALATLINLFDPQALILSGGITRLGGFTLPIIRKVLNEQVFSLSGKDTPVLVSKLGANAYTLGAAGLIIRHVADGSILSGSHQ